jgi:hypothetical protein
MFNGVNRKRFKDEISDFSLMSKNLLTKLAILTSNGILYLTSETLETELSFELARKGGPEFFKSVFLFSKDDQNGQKNDVFMVVSSSVMNDAFLFKRNVIYLYKITNWHPGGKPKVSMVANHEIIYRASHSKILLFVF